MTAGSAGVWIACSAGSIAKGAATAMCLTTSGAQTRVAQALARRRGRNRLMGEILGLGMTHYPPLTGRDEDMATILRRVLKDPGLPERYRNPTGWPESMRREYGADGGTASAAAHRDTLLRHFRKARRRLDEFQPDVVIMWGDDQHENFTDDVIPPFCVLAYDDIEARPWQKPGVAPNVWSESPETTFKIAGHRAAGKYLASGLLEQGVDMAYAYKPLHFPGLAHAFLNTIMFLDYDRVGFPYPVIPFQVNCYGRRVISQRGGRGSLANPVTEPAALHGGRGGHRAGDAGQPVAHGAHRLLELVARLPHRQELPALSRHRGGPPPLRGAARRRLRDMAHATPGGHRELGAAGDAQLVHAGRRHGGARPQPDQCDFIETWSFNSNKCFALFEP